MLARRPTAWFAAAFAAGVGGARLVPGWPALPFVLLALALAVLAAAVLAGRTASAPLSPVDLDSPLAAKPGWIVRLGRERILFGLGLLFAAAGAFRQESQARHMRRVASAFPSVATVRAVVETPPESAIAGRARGRWQCPVTILSVDGADVSIPVSLQAAGYGRRDFRRGDCLVGRIRYAPPRPAAWPGAFDERQYLETRALAGRARFFGADGEAAYTVLRHPLQSPGRRLDSLRAWGVRRCLGAMPERRGAFLAAALFGYRREVDLPLRDAFRNVGLGHLMAISGLHVGLIAGLFWWIFGRIGLNRRPQAAACIAVTLLYLALSGGRVAATRATVMAVLYFGGWVLLRKSDFINSLGAAALLILFHRPAALVDLGFQLSFVAVLFIASLCGWVERTWMPGPVSRPGASPARRARRALLGLFVLSLSAWLGVWPLVARAFHLFAPLGILANIAALPLMSLVLAGGLLALPLGCLPAPVGPAAAWAATLPAEALFALGEGASRVPGMWHAVPPPSPVWLVLYYGGFAALPIAAGMSPPAGRRRGVAFALGAVAFAALGICLGFLPGGPPPETRVTLLPGRAGDCAVVEKADGTILVAGHVERAGLDAARYLHYRRRERVQLVLPFTSARDGSPPPLAALENLLPVDRVIAVPRDRLDGERASRFAETREAGGVTLYLSRDGEGRLVWWAVECDGIRAGIGEWSWRRQAAYRFRTHRPGTHAPLVILRVRGGEEELDLARSLPNPWIFVGHRDAAAAEGIRAREAWGALVLRRAGDAVRLEAYDGARWRTPPRR